jgi:hypothetical protein
VRFWLDRLLDEPDLRRPLAGRRVALLALPGDGTLLLGLAAVIEDQSGNLSYWALAHRAEKPDFHSPAGFVVEIERASTW